MVQLLGNIPGSPARVDGRPVGLERVGLTIFSTDRDAVQSCTAKDASGNEIALEVPSRHEQWDDAGDLYYVVAHSVERVPAQTVQVVCTDQNTSYFVGQRQSADMFVGPLVRTLGSFFGPAAIGVVLIVIDQVRRRRRAVR
ncbi:hypothetical protein AB0E63_00795 [Kribbella sp. NPDC026596]|uniref:hypothetical protein n=1 Tax=Kribbella sp. NPDC026596 TaxID=3155122 RepID=UPI0033E2032C